MILVAGPPVPTSEVAFRALRAAPSAPIGTAVHPGCTAVTQATLPLRTRGDCARAIALAVDRRYRPMSSVLCRQERDRRLLDQAHAAEECVASRAHVK